MTSPGRQPATPLFTPPPTSFSLSSSRPHYSGRLSQRLSGTKTSQRNFTRRKHGASNLKTSCLTLTLTPTLTSNPATSYFPWALSNSKTLIPAALITKVVTLGLRRVAATLLFLAVHWPVSRIRFHWSPESVRPEIMTLSLHYFHDGYT